MRISFLVRSLSISRCSSPCWRIQISARTERIRITPIKTLIQCCGITKDVPSLLMICSDSRARIKVIYPEPTIFASHPLISLTPSCKRLAEALVDPELQQIAWAEHGFRTGLIGVNNDPKLITVAKLPDTIALVVPMPSAKVMSDIVAAVQP